MDLIPQNDYPRDRSIGELFEAAVSRTPNAIAVTYASESLTYEDLNGRANTLAARLRNLGIGRDSMVGCCCNRSLELIVALVGILKAGGCYVPLDPTYPVERLTYMLDDTRCAAIVTTSDLGATLAKRAGLQTIVLDTPEASLGTANIAPIAEATDLAYVMYTSGSTGKPKGVLVEHRSIIRLVSNTNYCRFGADEVWLHFAPLAFDASTLEIWGALLSGSRLVIAPPRASLEDLGRIITDTGVTSMWLTSGLFNLMVESRLSDLRGVRQLLAGGDTLSARHVRIVLDNLPECTLINGYGPTENTTFTCCYPMSAGQPVQEPVPIGFAIAHTSVYILNDDLQPVDQGETGEIYTGGDGVARGYLNNADETRERFLFDPFSLRPGARMYRTGDLGRTDSDGLVHFQGRADNQVKLLGHRIEPSEIEVVLGAHESVGQVSVTVHTDDQGGKRLIAYYVAKGHDIGPSALRAYLAEKLPRYMIPALIVPMCAMPLNHNGKVDKSALPKPQISTGPVDIALRSPGAATPPLAMEDIVRNAWCRALQRDNVGGHETFFDAGGDSLKLVSLHAELERRLAREVPIVDLFEFNTLNALVRYLQGAGRNVRQIDADQDRAKRQRAALARQRDQRGRSLVR